MKNPLVRSIAGCHPRSAKGGRHADRGRSLSGLPAQGRGGERGRGGLPRDRARRPSGEVAGGLLLAQGLHLRLPDGDRGVRAPRARVRRARSAAPRREHGQRVRAPRLAPLPPGPARAALPDARGPAARPLRGPRLPRPPGGRVPARHLPGRPGGGDPRRVVQRPLHGAEPRGGAPGPRRAPDRGALPRQLEARREDPGGGLTGRAFSRPRREPPLATKSNAKTNQQTVEELCRLLADSYTLYLKTHNFHWNVTGPMFTTLHTLFEAQYTELALAVDEIAERIRTLGAPAPGTYVEFAQLTAVKEAKGVPAAQQMVRQLTADQATVSAAAQRVVEASQAAGDEASADLGIRRLQVHQKNAWMLRSHLEK